jgi:hypothetical protein
VVWRPYFLRFNSAAGTDGQSRRFALEAGWRSDSLAEPSRFPGWVMPAGTVDARAGVRSGPVGFDALYRSTFVGDRFSDGFSKLANSERGTEAPRSGSLPPQPSRVRGISVFAQTTLVAVDNIPLPRERENLPCSQSLSAPL